MLLGGFINGDDSGRVRLNQIMHSQNTGFVRSVQDIGIARTENIAKDLNLSAIADYFPTKTFFGRIFLNEALSKPRVGEALQTVVLPRQKAIKALVEDPVLMTEIGVLLERIHQEEEYIVTLLSDSCQKTLCSERDALEKARIEQTWFYPIDRFWFLNKPFNIAAYVTSIVAIIGTTVTIGNWAKIAYDNYQPSYDPFKHDRKLYLQSNALYFGAMKNIFGKGLAPACTLFGNFYKSYNKALSKQRLLSSLHVLIESTEKLNALCAQHTINTHYSLSQITDQAGKELIESLKHSRYKDKKSYFIMKPLVDILLYDFYDLQDQLAQLFIAIGEMDTYHAIAQKFVDNQHTHTKFCFAEYSSDAQRSTIAMDGFWNLLVKTPVINTIHESRNIMLTGPNAGGKTTSIRAILQNIILAQTFGIAAAEQCTLTAFDVIHSYLNISDDIQHGLSLFASEIKRAQEIVHTAQSLQPHERYFFALDELFTSTVAEDGEQCAYEFIKDLETHTNMFCIYATHFNKIKELEQESAAFVNYKIDDPAILDDGTLKYPFTISKGASRARFALHIACRAGLIK